MEWLFWFTKKKLKIKVSIWSNILANLPEVAGPTQKRLSFKEKLKWTSIILIIYFYCLLFTALGFPAPKENEMQVQIDILTSQISEFQQKISTDKK